MSLSEILRKTIDYFYLPFVARFFTRQMFRYAACGGLNFLVLDPLLYFLIYHYVVTPDRFFDLGVMFVSSHIASMILVFPLTSFNGFWLNRNVVFGGSRLRRRTQFVRYVISIGGSVLLTYAGLKFFVEVCHIWPTPAKVITTVITVVYSFLAAKYFSFRD